MGNSVNPYQSLWESLPNAEVKYSPESQTLYISNGKPARIGEEIAKWVVVFTDESPESDDNAEANSAVAIQIDDAEAVLKPFVDAILAKYAANPPDLPSDRMG